uniref:Dynein axonemal assembly factor 4 n=1 Tax=Cyprinus carpio TaxID=7962 RepID=A0A8C2EZR0_CYPCA
MSLIVRDHTWTQNLNKVYMSVPLKGVKTTNVHVICKDEYLRVSFPPFLFEVFLFRPINEEKSEARIADSVAVFTLQKRRDELWEQLYTNIGKLRDLSFFHSIEIYSRFQEKEAEKSEAKAARIQQEKKYVLETMMKLENEERDRIQKIKDEECARAAAELDFWKEMLRKTAEENENQTKLQGSSTHNNQQRTERANAAPAVMLFSHIFLLGQISKKQKPKDLPAPRSAGCVKISFTPRVFPTALRKSRVPEEEEWLKKQAEARRAVDTDLAELDDLRKEERNPDWLKEKGKNISDYHQLLHIFVETVACHLKLRNLHKAIEDSSQALELLIPAVAANAPAACNSVGPQDYHAALEIDPHNAALRADTDKIREIIIIPIKKIPIKQHLPF